jgi:hypothetical protein
MYYFQVAKTMSEAYVADCSGRFVKRPGGCASADVMRIAALLQIAALAACSRNKVTGGFVYVFSQAGD